MKRVFLKGIKGGIGIILVVVNFVCVLRKLNEFVFVIDLD